MADTSDYTTGSRIRVIEESADFCEGEICIIVEDDGDGEPLVRKEDDADSDTDYLADSYFEVIDKYPDEVQTPVPCYNPGDMVTIRRTGGKSCWSKYRDGDTLEVKNPVDLDGDVRLWNKDRTESHYVHHTNLRRSGQTAEKAAAVLRVGDLVRVTGGHYFQVGDICMVEGSLGSNMPRLKRVTDGLELYVFRKNIELENNKLDKDDNDMSDLISEPLKALRDVDLDEDTTTLRKYGFENSEGRRSSSANDAMLDQMWKEQRAAFAKRLRDLEAKEATPPAAASSED